MSEDVQHDPGKGPGGPRGEGTSGCFPARHSFTVLQFCNPSPAILPVGGEGAGADVLVAAGVPALPGWHGKMKEE